MMIVDSLKAGQMSAASVTKENVRLNNILDAFFKLVILRTQ
jgi:hypothetical protein